jgi:hypothetical protein
MENGEWRISPAATKVKNKCDFLTDFIRNNVLGRNFAD